MQVISTLLNLQLKPLNDYTPAKWNSTIIRQPGGGAISIIEFSEHIMRTIVAA